MIEFFNNIWAWICANKESITAVLTSVEFTALAGLLVSVCKNISSNRKNTLSVNSLAEVVSSNSTIKGDVETVKDVSVKTSDAISGLTVKIDELKRDIEEHYVQNDTKFNCLFEVFSVVYSTIKDESVRTTVSSLLNNAKYAVDMDKARLQQENTELREKLNELTSFVESISETSKTDVVHPDSTTGRRRY